MQSRSHARIERIVHLRELARALSSLLVERARLRELDQLEWDRMQVEQPMARRARKRPLESARVWRWSTVPFLLRNSEEEEGQILRLVQYCTVLTVRKYVRVQNTGWIYITVHHGR